MFMNRLGLIQIIGAKKLKRIMEGAAQNDHRLSEADSKKITILSLFHIGRAKKLLSKYPTPMMRPIGDDQIELNYSIDGYHITVTTPKESAPNMIHHIIPDDSILHPLNPDSI